jgi:polyferredoxin
MAMGLTVWRRITQWFSLVALNTNFIGFSSGGWCVPVLNCEACALSWLVCPIGRMSGSIAFHEFPWLVLGIVVVVGLLVGRMFCGWVCPMGLLQDMLYKIPSPKVAIAAGWRWMKYAFLLGGVVLVSYYIGKENNLFFFCHYCPIAALQVVAPAMISTGDYVFDLARTQRFTVLAFILVLAVLNHRSFCKIMCPIGAMQALTNKFSFFRLRMNATGCVHCHRCDKSCPMDVPVEACSRTGRGISRHTECIECLSCQEVCPVSVIRSGVAGAGKK